MFLPYLNKVYDDDDDVGGGGGVGLNRGACTLICKLTTILNNFLDLQMFLHKSETEYDLFYSENKSIKSPIQTA